MPRKHTGPADDRSDSDEPPSHKRTTVYFEGAPTFLYHDVDGFIPNDGERLMFRHQAEDADGRPCPVCYPSEYGDGERTSLGMGWRPFASDDEELTETPERYASLPEEQRARIADDVNTIFAAAEAQADALDEPDDESDEE